MVSCQGTVMPLFFGSHMQRCRSVRNIGGYNSAFLPFFRDIQVFANFSSLNDFENLWVYSGFNENLLKQLKSRNKKH